MRPCMSGAHYIIHFIFQNIALFPSSYCNKLKISVFMGFLKLVLGLNTA